VKLLLDENLSPKVAESLACDDGLYACHTRDRGLLGATDPEVLERAFVEDRIFVTRTSSTSREARRGAGATCRDRPHRARRSHS